MPKKYLNGSDVASFIMERQRGVVRGMDTPPVLEIIYTNANPVSDAYLKIKQRYAEDIGAKVIVTSVPAKSAVEAIRSANEDESIDGIIIQLPLDDASLTDQLLSAVVRTKDVDGLGDESDFDPATPTAILWLLSAYNIPYESKRILVIGQGRLVGDPLTRLLRASGCTVEVADETTKNLPELLMSAEVIISAAGVPRLLSAEIIPHGAVVIDAGTATDNGEIVGDASDELRARDDIMITPLRGGVGPLTVAALFENLLRAAKR